MEIKQIAEQVLHYHDINNYKIYQIFTTGSQVFVDNPKDLDFVIIADGIPNGRIRRHKPYKGTIYDMIFLTPEYYKDQLDLNLPIVLTLYNYHYLPQFKNILYDSGEIEVENFDFFKEGNEAYYVKSIYTQYQNSYINVVNPESTVNKWYLYVYIVLSIYRNGFNDLTEEQKENIFIIYNKQEGITDLIAEIQNEITDLYSKLQEEVGTNYVK